MSTKLSQIFKFFFKFCLKLRFIISHAAKQTKRKSQRIFMYSIFTQYFLLLFKLVMLICQFYKIKRKKMFLKKFKTCRHLQRDLATYRAIINGISVLILTFFNVCGSMMPPSWLDFLHYQRVYCHNVLSLTSINFINVNVMWKI